MNNEPVAWLLFRDGGETYPEYTTSYKQMREWENYLGDNERIEPHYTTLQIKELSDEEIYKLAGEFWIEGSFDDGELDYVGFARAILKKASEK
jgi:hypothetical protein